MDTQVKDYAEIARTRITEQFKGKENIDRLMRMWLEGYQEIQEVILELFGVLDIDSARGEQLEIIGEIVGQPREVVEIDVTGYFGFEGNTAAKSFGSLDNDQGGIYYSLRDPLTGSVVLSDSLYRSFIKAKIIDNNAGGSAEDIIVAAKEILGVDYVEITENGNASMSINIGRRAWNDPQHTAFPGLDEAALARKLLPFPVGVKINFIDEPVKASPLTSIEEWEEASDRLWETANTVFPNNLNF